MVRAARSRHRNEAHHRPGGVPFASRTAFKEELGRFPNRGDPQRNTGNSRVVILVSLCGACYSLRSATRRLAWARRGTAASPPARYRDSCHPV